MGSCVSVHKNPKSAMRYRFSFRPKTEDKFVIPSPIKDDEKPSNNLNRPIPDLAFKYQLSPPSFRDFGSKEERFFDSQPWLESDCDDDFFSVNGDFTPSRGNTPVHHSFSVGTIKVNRPPFEDKMPGSIPTPSPKKRLSELFQESNEDGQGVDQDISGNKDLANGKSGDVKPTVFDLPPKSANDTPYVSGANSVCSSERTPNGTIKQDKERSLKSVQCCLPRLLLPSHSFNERNKSMTAV